MNRRYAYLCRAQKTEMKRFLIYISIAIAFALSSATEASAQVANTVPQPKFTIDTDIYDLRFATMPYFSYVYDDITQYAPAALVAGLKVFGYEGRTKWGGMIVSDVFSVGIMAGTVKGIKYIVNRQRPYGGDHSFPSGHTATSFMTATMLHKEYGWRSPWFSIGGYTIAAVTGVSRIMNNAHWLSDVMAGAAIGIGSVHLGYYLTDLIFKGKHLYDGYEKPVFEYNTEQKHYTAEMFFARRFILGDSDKFADLVLPFRGSVAGVQTDIPVVPGAGLTGRVYAGSMKYSAESVSAVFSASAGGFYNIPFAKRFEFQGRAGVGYAGMNGKNGMNLTAGAGLSFMLDSNFKIKGFAEYETIGLLPASPWIHSILLGYSVGWFW